MHSIICFDVVIGLEFQADANLLFDFSDSTMFFWLIFLDFSFWETPFIRPCSFGKQNSGMIFI